MRSDVLKMKKVSNAETLPDAVHPGACSDPPFEDGVNLGPAAQEPSTQTA